MQNVVMCLLWKIPLKLLETAHKKRSAFCNETPRCEIKPDILAASVAPDDFEPRARLEPRRPGQGVAAVCADGAHDVVLVRVYPLAKLLGRGALAWRCQLPADAVSCVREIPVARSGCSLRGWRTRRGAGTRLPAS